jgi:hypothetical protein
MYPTTSAGSLLGNSQFATAAEVVRPPQVQDQVNTLEINAKDLSEIVSALISKLSSVTQPRPEISNSKLSVPEPVLVPLASKLREVCSDVRSSVDRLRDLCASIELTS